VNYVLNDGSVATKRVKLSIASIHPIGKSTRQDRIHVAFFKSSVRTVHQGLFYLVFCVNRRVQKEVCTQSWHWLATTAAFIRKSSHV